MLADVANTDLTGKAYIDEDPSTWPDVYLDSIMQSKLKPKGTSGKGGSFLTYVTGSDADRAELRIRVNAKPWPKTTEIRAPPYMDDYVKTTLVRYKDDPEWHLIEDRIPIKNAKSLEDQDVEYSLHFAQ